MQICQEALLENSSRHDFLKKYAAQVLHSYPQLHDQVHSRLQLLNQQWLAVQTSIETSLADSCVKSIQQGTIFSFLCLVYVDVGAMSGVWRCWCYVWLFRCWCYVWCMLMLVLCQVYVDDGAMSGVCGCWCYVWYM